MLKWTNQNLLDVVSTNQNLIDAVFDQSIHFRCSFDQSNDPFNCNFETKHKYTQVHTITEDDEWNFPSSKLYPSSVY